MKRKECSASLLESLVNEIVAHTVRTAPPDLVNARLEEVGAAIGRRLAERLTRDRGRFASDLESVRFLCKGACVDPGRSFSTLFSRVLDGAEREER